MLTVQVIDIDRIYFAVSELSKVDQNKVIKRGLRKGSKYLVDRGKTNIKNRKTGNLYNSLVNKVKRRKLGALAGFNVLGKHAHLIDSGTTDRYTSRGLYRGKITGNYFWTESVSSNNNQALEILYDSIEDAVNKIIDRNGK